jgi:polyvinyl alcohol dehydrogenase (cytochrome)
MRSGKIEWVRQLTAGDAWNFGCDNPAQGNCPNAAGGDFDIGAPPILRTTSNKRRVLLVGQKSGIVYALDPDARGKILWRTRISRGGTLGGIEWGGAADDRIAYFAVSDFNLANVHAGAGGVYALTISTGKQLWHAAPPDPKCMEQRGCSAAQPAPVTLVPGALFSGSMDGHMRAFRTTDGCLIWDYDTLRQYETVNGIKAKGGSLNAAGPVIGRGMLYVSSGYGLIGGMPGNVLLAFSVDGR